jgi:hypothetical protein
VGILSDDGQSEAASLGGEFEMMTTEATMFAVIDSENVIWGTGSSEESAMLDARHWLGLNHEDGADVLGAMTAQPCTKELAESVQVNGGHVRWEWSGTLPRYMQIVIE